MTLRNSWARRPPFLFSKPARVPNIPCKPVVSVRTPTPTYFLELALAPGPQQIAVPGDNRYSTLFGREWALVWCDGDRRLHLYQEDAEVTGKWDAVTASLPPVFSSALPDTARRISFAFDQAGRLAVAYEDTTDGLVKVTRWDQTLNQYLQNVSFEGVDPWLVIDAAWTRRVPDSDVLLFYLSSDRTKLMCRVQAQSYAVEHEVFDFDGEVVVLDKVVALPWRYEVLLGDRFAESRTLMLVSELYPVYFQQRVRLEPEFIGGALDVVAADYYPLFAVRVGAEFSEGALDIVVHRYEPTVTLVLDAEFSEGALDIVVHRYEPTIPVVIAAEFVAGERVDIPTYITSQAVRLAAEFAGGSYAPA